MEIHYDPMISKLTTWGRTREEAIDRMLRAIDEYEIAGVETTLPFCRFVMGHEAFRSGRFSTHFVADHFDPEVLSPGPAADEAVAAAAVWLKLHSGARNQPSLNGEPEAPASRWSRRKSLG